jgi:hypothetical protein
MSTPRLAAQPEPQATEASVPASPPGSADTDRSARGLARLKAALFGRARDLHDSSIFHQVSLIPFLAWVGLGADGLSSSSYGPEEAFRTLGAHSYLAVFISVGVIDSGGFKGADCIESLEATTQAMLQRYLSLATELGIPSTYRMAIGTEAIAEAEKLCRGVLAEFPLVTFVGGKVVFAREQWFQRLLHNETATAIQKRLYWMGATMVILPAKVQ